jgi:hypothetical protein
MDHNSQGIRLGAEIQKRRTGPLAQKLSRFAAMIPSLFTRLIGLLGEAMLTTPLMLPTPCPAWKESTEITTTT